MYPITNRKEGFYHWPGVDVEIVLSLENLALNLALGNNVNSVPTKLLKPSLARKYRTIIKSNLTEISYTV